MRICIVSDFFYPRLGGVELHQYQLAQGLMQRGHTVIIVTGTYTHKERGKRQGVRYMTNGLKVYYCPIMSLHQQASLPNLFCFAPLLRNILLRERIELVHGHQSTSALAHESMLHARTMGLPTVFTDHSLFSFANVASIHLNKVMKFSLTSANAVICVSHCSKENLTLRAYLEPTKVHVIPNAVDTTKLRPEPKNAPDITEREETLPKQLRPRGLRCVHPLQTTLTTSVSCPVLSPGFTIVVLSRLVYRKGMDLIIDVIPQICSLFPTVHFLIGGDGPKRTLMEEMREKYQLQDRVEMIGAVAHTEVQKVLTRGHMFLNCSLTEAFCIAILEAVSCGLYVVSTRVGGVPEILPPETMSFAEPNVEDIVKTIRKAIPYTMRMRHKKGVVYEDGDGDADGEDDFPMRMHRMVRDKYNWHDVAERTERVYNKVLKEHQSSEEMLESYHHQRHHHHNELHHLNDAYDGNPPSIPLDPGSLFSLSLTRLSSYASCGIFVGLLFALVVILDHLLWRMLEWSQPRQEIDPTIDLKIERGMIEEDEDEEDTRMKGQRRFRMRRHYHDDDER